MTSKMHSPLPWHDNGFGISDSNGLAVSIYGGGKELGNRRVIIEAIGHLVEPAISELCAEIDYLRVSRDALLAAANEAISLVDGRIFPKEKMKLQATITAQPPRNHRL